MFAVIYAAIRAIINSLLAKKKLPTETSAYLDVGSIEGTEFHPYVPKERGTYDSSESSVGRKSIVGHFFGRERNKTEEEENFKEEE